MLLPSGFQIIETTIRQHSQARQYKLSDFLGFIFLKNKLKWQQELFLELELSEFLFLYKLEGDGKVLKET